MTTDNDFDEGFAEVETPVDVSAEPPVDDVPVDEPGDAPDAEPAGDQEPAPAGDVEPGAVTGGETDALAEQAESALGNAVKGFADTAAITAPKQPEIDPKYLAQAIAEAQEQLQASKTPAAPVEEPKPASFEDYLDDKDKAALEVFKAEWSEVAAPVSALISAHVKAALANQEKQILSQMEQQLVPIQQVTAKSQEAAHRASIAAAHPDFQEVVAALPAWIEKQPSFIQPALRQAYERGTAAEVNELLATYKQAIGTTGAAPVNPASSAAQVQPRVAPVNKAALAATLAPPTAQRSTVSPSKDPNDFEAAFAEGL